MTEGSRPDAVEYTGITKQIRVNLQATTPEGEFAEAGMFMANIRERDLEDFRQQVRQLASEHSVSEPEITETPIPYSGGGLTQAGLNIAVNLAYGVGGNAAFAAIVLLGKQFMPATRRAGAVVPGEAEMQAQTKQSAHRMALEAIRMKYPLAEDEVVADEDPQNSAAERTYHARDGATFKVTIEGDSDSWTIHTQRIPPDTPMTDQP